MLPDFDRLDLSKLPSPAYVLNLAQLERNLQILQDVQLRSGVKILLAMKAFSPPVVAPLIRQYLSGVCASGLYEARLGAQEFAMPVHAYGAAYPDAHIPELASLSQHLVFNSIGQLQRHRAALDAHPKLDIGLRLNPQHPVATTLLYDPSAPRSRLGMVRDSFEDADVPDCVTGFHMHNLCGNGLEALKASVTALEDKFPALLERAHWLNLGGGHTICEDDYDREGLVTFLQDLSARWDVQVYMEPGETVAHQVGGLVTTVLDTSWNHGGVAIVDCSTTAHVPDVLEAGFRVEIQGAGQPGELSHTYRIGGLTCLSGDVMGDYSFDEPLEYGQRLLVEDTAYYTMVKTTTFNGVGLPAIVTWDPRSDQLDVVQEFGYDDFRRRLG